MKGEARVGGLLCSEVLAVLSEYIDGQLDEPTRNKVEAHVAICAVCERFGGSVGASVAALRRQKRAPSDDRAMDASLARLRLALPDESAK